MPLRIVRSETSDGLWTACLENWLTALGDHPGPEAHGARLWLTHRTQRHAALTAAAELGLPGWFDPPVHFLSELRRLFDIRARPIGVLTGRLLVARLARERAGGSGMAGGPALTGPARAHMLDGLFGELLAEGIPPDALRSALAELESDAFTRERDDWVAETYRAFLTALDARGLYDARQIHALVAQRIESGGLSAALRGATALHVYGLTSLARRQRLFRALAAQSEVYVTIYLICEPEPSDWEELADDVATRDAESPPKPDVQPAPDALREAAFVARRIKRLLVEQEVPPREIAVVARSGREDTRHVHRALEEAGVPSTARLRTPLAEIPALRALLALFRAEASGWTYRDLRLVGTSPYFGLGLDPRPLDYLASERRITGLAEWSAALTDLRSMIARHTEEIARHTEEPAARRLRARGLFEDRVAATAHAVASLAERMADFAAERPEAEWIDVTRRLTGGDAFGYRRRLCQSVGERYDVVRLDQRGVHALDALLAEWRELVGGDTPLTVGEWRDRLRRLLEANELALSTPLEEGVQVLEAHEAALTPYRHVFVVHANDGEFPRPPRSGGILSDAERSRLRAAGLPLENRSLALRRERALWRAVTAGSGVTVTYRTSTAAGVPLLPSLMVPEHEPGSALPRTAVHAAGDVEAVSPAEQLRQEVLRVSQRHRAGEDGPTEVVDVQAVRQAVVAAFAEELRTGGLDDVGGIEAMLGLEPPPLLGRDRPVSERAHAWGARLRDPVVRAVLADRFGPDRVWSASQLQQYGTRPFDFLLARVLRIEGREEAEEETTPLASGSVVHAVLERLHGRLLEADAAGFAAGESLVAGVCAEVFAEVEREAELWLGLPALWSLKREDLRRLIGEFAAWDFEELARKRARPIAVEFRFGGDGGDPVRLRGADLHGRPGVLYLAGRIDRVDRSDSSGGWIRTIDYKLGDPPARRGYEDGALLQSALYMRAWESVRGEAPREGLFFSVRKPGAGSRSPLTAVRVEEVMRFALSIPARIRAGLFEPVQAASCGAPAPWQPGPEITRTEACITAGNRFDHAGEGNADE